MTPRFARSAMQISIVFEACGGHFLPYGDIAMSPAIRALQGMKRADALLTVLVGSKHSVVCSSSAKALYRQIVDRLRAHSMTLQRKDAVAKKNKHWDELSNELARSSQRCISLATHRSARGKLSSRGANWHCARGWEH